MTKSVEEYEKIIKRLILSNGHRFVDDYCLIMGIDFGFHRYSWVGDKNTALDVPINYLFREVIEPDMEDERYEFRKL